MIKNKLNRRDFLKVLGTTGASLMLGIYLGGCDQAPMADSTTTIEGSEATPDEAAVDNKPSEGRLEADIYLKIDPDETVTVTAFRSEMGQGVRTAIAMILAEELDANWENVVIKQAPADPAYGNQVTGGSASISGSYFELRMSGARVRRMLINAGAETWGVDPGNCQTEAGFVIHPDGKKQLSYGALAGSAANQEIPQRDEYTMKAEDEFRIIGTDKGHWDAPDIITGKAIYGMDVRLPGMLYAAIARSPAFGGRIDKFDGSKAFDIPGVKAVHVIDGWIAVVAENTWAAIKGRDVLEINWQGGDESLSSQIIQDKLLSKTPQLDSDEDDQIEALYEFPYQAHMTMEPMNCTAHVKDDTCEVWAPTQSAQDVQRDVQRALGFPRNSVIVYVTLMGGGFGRRLQSDYAVEAAKLAQALEAPVQVVWTRADDVRHDFYHPLHVLYVKADPKVLQRPRVRVYDGASYIPTGAWRSVGNHPEAFATECFIDEMADARGVDPLALRREIYSGRSLAVIELAAEKAGWGAPLAENWGRGLAFHATFGVTHVAMVAEVEVINGEVWVRRVVCAVDAGIAINPENIAAQMEGGIAFGLTAALKAGVTLENGAIKESNFHDCPILRMDEMPQVEVYLIESSTIPSGIGEMGVPPIAPAVANAVFDATGIRVRHLPIKKTNLGG